MPGIPDTASNGDMNMQARLLLLAAAIGLVLCGTAAAATDVIEGDLQNAPPLDNILAADVNVISGSHVGDLDATTVANDYVISLYNGAAAAVTVTGSKLTVQGGGTLNIGREDDGTPSTGAITINLESGGLKTNLTVGDSTGTGTINLGATGGTQGVTIVGKRLGIADGDVTYTDQTGAIILNFEELVFNKGTLTMAGATNGLTISGAATVGDGTSADGTAILTVSGTGTSGSTTGARFLSGLIVAKGGTLTNTGNATVYLGTSGALRLMGGRLESSADDLTLNTKTVTVDGDAKSVIDGSAGGQILFATGTNMTVKQDLDIVDAQISVTGYNQTAGVVTAGGTSRLTAAGAATVTGATSVFAGNASFAEGASFTNGATLGGAVDSLIAAASGKTVSVNAASYVDLSTNNVDLAAGTAAAISGTIKVGSGQLGLATGATLTFDASSSFRVTGSVAVGQIVVRANGLPSIIDFDLANAVDDQFLLGEYRFAQNATTGDIYVESALAGELLDGTDWEKVRDRVIDKYGPIMNTPGFIENIYKSVSNAPAGHYLDPLRPDPAVVAGSGSAIEKSYLMNLENFQAFASNHAAVRDGSLAAMYTGLGNTNVAEVAITSANSLISRVHEHVRLNSAVRAGLRETVCGGEDAVLNATAMNHPWLGGFGMWEDTDARDGMAGYRYDSAGFITGYDRAMGPLTVGGVFAYAKGDYSDKSALRHDSTIASYSGAVHATYNHESGFYATGTLGYTYSENDIKEMRGDASVASGKSWNTADYHSTTLNGGLEVGYDFRTGTGLAVTPSLGLRHIRTDSSDHGEYLGDRLAGDVKGVKKSATYIPVRVDLGHTIVTGSESTLRLNAGAGYAYRLHTDTFKGTFQPVGFANALPHAVNGREADRHYYTLSAGMQFTTGPVNFSLDYDYAGASETSNHRLTGSVGFTF